MIFLGDIACPTDVTTKSLESMFERHLDIFNGQAIIVNFEGLVANDQHLYQHSPILFNHPAVPALLKRYGVAGVGLANNHTLDIPEAFDTTTSLLEEVKIQYAGAGKSYDEANRSIRLESQGFNVVVFNACWDFLLYHQKNPSNGLFVAEIDELELIKKVRQSKNEAPESKIVIFLHWSFDLETLPFPMYRQWARKLIEEGVSCVIGCHSHCVQGGEPYKDGYIIYGLGNFFIPDHMFANGNLSFPDFSKIQMGFEWDIKQNKGLCHWWRYSYNKTTGHQLEHIETADVATSKLLKKYSPYQNMDEKTYYTFFKNNRRKKRLIPIYRSYTNIQTNWMRTQFLKIRGKIARFLAQIGFIKWQH